MDDNEQEAEDGSPQTLAEYIDSELQDAILYAWVDWEEWTTRALQIPPESARQLRALAERFRSEALHLVSAHERRSSLDGFWNILSTTATGDRESWARKDKDALRAALGDDEGFARVEAYFLRDTTSEPTDYLAPLLQLGFVDDARDASFEMVERCVRLQKLSLTMALPADVASYVGRPARLYVYGFYAEAIALARTALEAALREVVDSNDDARDSPPEKQPPSLQEMIRLARASNLIDALAYDCANRLRIQGNRVLHAEPSASPSAADAFGACAQLVLVVGQIANASRGSRDA